MIKVKERPLQFFLVRIFRYYHFMKRSINLHSYSIITFFLIISIASGQKRYLSLSGTYDFDRDGFSEFLTLEKLAPKDISPRIAAVYEIDDLGEHTQVWKYTSNFPLTGAAIADLEGDGIPEIVVVENPSLPLQDIQPSIISLFPWTGGNFSQTTFIQWQPSEKTLPSHPLSMTIIDLENDNRDEIAVALGSPLRTIKLLTLNNEVDPPILEISATLTSPHLSTGYGRITLSTIDDNGDGFLDLMAISQELDELKVEIFENSEGHLLSQKMYPIRATDLGEDITDLEPYGITTTDVNQDGELDVVLPFRTGVATALFLSPDTIEVTPLESTVAGLFHFPPEGVSEVDVNEALLARAELGIGGMKARKIKLEAVGKGEPFVPEALPVQPKKVRQLELTSLKPVPSKEAGEKEEEITAEEVPPPIEKEEVTPTPVEEPVTPPGEIELKAPGIGKKVQKVQLKSLTRAEEAGQPPAPKMTLPPGATISDTLFVGVEFTLPLDTLKGKKFRAIRPKELPKGASFDPTTRSLIWIPTAEQVGLHKIAYDVEYELLGERVEIAETKEELQVVTKTESLSKEIYIWVKSLYNEENK